MRKTLPNRSAASSALAWSSNPLRRSSERDSSTPKLLYARTISTGDSASSAIPSASSRSATPPTIAVHHSCRSDHVEREGPHLSRPRVSAISRASRPISVSGSAPTIRKRAKFASTNAFEREAGAPPRVGSRAGGVLARSGRRPPFASPARSDSDSAALSTSPVRVKWASASLQLRLSSCSACQNSAFPGRKSRSARSRRSEASSSAPRKNCAAAEESVQRGSAVAGLPQGRARAVLRAWHRLTGRSRELERSQVVMGEHLREVVGPLRAIRATPQRAGASSARAARGIWPYATSRTRRWRNVYSVSPPTVERLWRRTNSLRSSERSVSSIESCCPIVRSALGQNTLPMTAASWISAFSSARKHVEPRCDQPLNGLG